MNKRILVPAVTILLMAAMLLGVSSGLSDLRAKNVQDEHVRMMKTLLPGSESFVREPYTGDDTSVRSVHKAENGFVIETVTQGYVGDIAMMIGVSNEGAVTGLVIRDMEETLGIGRNALNDADFLAQFLNTQGNVTVASHSDAVNGTTFEAGETVVDAVTGATVTSKAIARSVNSAVAVVTGADAASSATSWGG